MDNIAKSDRYRHIVENIRELPSLPSIVSRLIQVVNSPDTSADDAAELIEKDPALTSKMLRLANSAFYGMPRSISSISSAVVILGFNTIRSVALSATIMKMFSKNSPMGFFNYKRFWQHSIVCAMTAKDIAQHCLNLMMIDPESAFCAGVLHDIGKLIFVQFATEDYIKTCEVARKNKMSLIEAEEMVLGITHARIGTILADKWALPTELEYSLIYHHNPQDTDEVRELVTTVHVADILSHAANASLWDEEQAPPEWSCARSSLGIEEDYNYFFEKTKNNIKKSVEFFNIIG